MRPRTRQGRRAFTLIEMLVTLTIIMVAAAIVIPRLRDDSQFRLIAASQLMASDIELAQIMTITNPQDPTLVRFNPSAGEYWLAAASAPDDPIDRGALIEIPSRTVRRPRTRC